MNQYRVRSVPKGLNGFGAGLEESFNIAMESIKAFAPYVNCSDHFNATKNGGDREPLKRLFQGR
jgi:hypothetical protein